MSCQLTLCLPYCMMAKCWQESPAKKRFLHHKTNDMKKKAIKNKNHVSQSKTEAAPLATSISQAVTQLTGRSNDPTAGLPLNGAGSVSDGKPVAYKMRVECYDDGALLYEMLWPYLEYWEEKRTYIKAKGQQFEGPGFEIRFGITPGSLTLQNLQSLFHCVPDCHVAEETVALERNFTGEREALNESELEAPLATVIRPMLKRVERARRYVRVLVRRTEGLHTMLEGVASRGALPKMPRQGYLALLNHTASGMSSILRIAAAPGTDDPVGDRHLLMQQ